MSRVPADTFLVRVAVAAVLALPLAGCGDDEPESASGPATSPAAAAPPSASAATTPAQRTPTTPATAGPAGGKSSKAAPVEPAAVEAEPDADTPATAKKASAKKQSNDDIADGMKKVYDALKAEGFDPGKPIISGESSGALQIKETTIVFYASPRLAAQASARFTEALAESPQHVKVARKANRLFLMSLPTQPSPDQLATFRKIRQVANGAV